MVEVRYISTNCIYASMQFGMCYVCILYESSKDDSNDFVYKYYHIHKEPHVGSRVYANV